MSKMGVLMMISGVAWVAQFVKRLSAFGSGHDPGSWDPAPHGAPRSAESASPPASAPSPACSLSLSQINFKVVLSEGGC